MNKIHKAIDEIKLNENDKEKIYENIMDKYNEKKNTFSFTKILRYASIVVIVSIFSIGSVYVFSKIFNWDNNFLNFFYFSKEEAEINNFPVSVINKEIDIDDAVISIKQGTIFNNDTYLLLNVKFKKALSEQELDSWTLYHGIGLVIDNEINYGIIEVKDINKDKTEAIMVACINTDKSLKLNQEIEIRVQYDYNVILEDDGSGIGDFKKNKSIAWKVDILPITSEYNYVFNDKIYVKENNDIKIYPTNINITPIGVYLNINIETDIEDLSDDELVKFDKDVVINFSDGKEIKLNIIPADDSFVHGRNIIGEDKDKDGKDIKTVSLAWESLYSNNNYTKYKFNLLDVNNLKSITIGDKFIDLNK